MIGESDPIIDAQNIYLTLTALAKIGITDVSLSINSYGNSKEMEKFTLELENYLENKSAVMSQSLQDEYKNNPMALFFSSDEDDAILASKAPHITKFLKKDSKKHYENFKMYLHDLGIEYQEASNFFFLEDFYTGIIWKIEDSSGNLLAS